jgi:hypothetical protein
MMMAYHSDTWKCPLPFYVHRGLDLSHQVTSNRTHCCSQGHLEGGEVLHHLQYDPLVLYVPLTCHGATYFSSLILFLSSKVLQSPENAKNVENLLRTPKDTILSYSFST